MFLPEKKTRQKNRPRVFRKENQTEEPSPCLPGNFLPDGKTRQKNRPRVFELFWEKRLANAPLRTRGSLAAERGL